MTFVSIPVLILIPFHSLRGSYVLNFSVAESHSWGTACWTSHSRRNLKRGIHGENGTVTGLEPIPSTLIRLWYSTRLPPQTQSFPKTPTFWTSVFYYLRTRPGTVVYVQSKTDMICTCQNWLFSCPPPLSSPSRYSTFRLVFIRVEPSFTPRVGPSLSPRLLPLISSWADLYVLNQVHFLLELPVRLFKRK